MIVYLWIFFGLTWAAAGPVVTVNAPAQVLLVAGSSATVRLDASVAPGFHIQANPASEPWLIAARLTIEKQSGVVIASPVYPPSKAYRLKGSDKDLAVYDGQFAIAVPLAAAKQARLGRRVLKGKLRYQACDQTTCLFPESVPISMAIEVVKQK